MCIYMKLFLVIASLLINEFPYATATDYIVGGSPGNVPINTGGFGSQAGQIIIDGNQDQGFLGATASGTFGDQDASRIGANLAAANQINLGTFPSGGSRRVANLGGINQNRASGINLGAPGILFNQPAVAGINLGGSPLTFAQPAVGGVNLVGSAQSGTGSFGVGAAGAAFGQPGVGGPAFAQPAVGGVNLVGSGQSGTGSFGVGAAGAAFGQAGIGGPGFNVGGGFGGGQGPTRVIEAPATPTVTKTVTIDHVVTLTDLAFHSVPVTLTDLVLRTTTVTSRQAIRTPIDDRVALQTSVIIRPTSLTVTCTKHDYRIVTDVAVHYVTITHTSYIIRQTTYTTTATQVSTYAATMVRTIVHTQRTTVTDYHTITNTVHGQGGYY